MALTAIGIDWVLASRFVAVTVMVSTCAAAMPVATDASRADDKMVVVSARFLSMALSYLVNFLISAV